MGEVIGDADESPVSLAEATAAPKAAAAAPEAGGVTLIILDFRLGLPPRDPFPFFPRVSLTVLVVAAGPDASSTTPPPPPSSAPPPSSPPWGASLGPAAQRATESMRVVAPGSAVAHVPPVSSIFRRVNGASAPWTLLVWLPGLSLPRISGWPSSVQGAPSSQAERVILVRRKKSVVLLNRKARLVSSCESECPPDSARDNPVTFPEEGATSSGMPCTEWTGLSPSRSLACVCPFLVVCSVSPAAESSSSSRSVGVSANPFRRTLQRPPFRWSASRPGTVFKDFMMPPSASAESRFPHFPDLAQSSIQHTAGRATPSAPSSTSQIDCVAGGRGASSVPNGPRSRKCPSRRAARPSPGKGVVWWGSATARIGCVSSKPGSWGAAVSASASASAKAQVALCCAFSPSAFLAGCCHQHGSAKADQPVLSHRFLLPPSSRDGADKPYERASTLRLEPRHHGQVVLLKAFRGVRTTRPPVHQPSVSAVFATGILDLAAIALH